MDPKQNRHERMTRVARKLSSSIRRQARGRWEEVRTAERNESNRHVWRFQDGPVDGERFLYIEHRAMVRGRDPAKRLLDQLEAENWLDRLQESSDAAVLLSRDGSLSPVARG